MDEHEQSAGVILETAHNAQTFFLLASAIFGAQTPNQPFFDYVQRIIVNSSRGGICTSCLYVYWLSYASFPCHVIPNTNGATHSKHLFQQQNRY